MACVHTHTHPQRRTRTRTHTMHCCMSASTTCFAKSVCVYVFVCVPMQTALAVYNEDVQLAINPLLSNEVQVGRLVHSRMHAKKTRRPSMPVLHACPCPNTQVTLCMRPYVRRLSSHLL